MTIVFTLDEIKALADVAELALDRDDAPVELTSAWLKLVRAQAEGLAVPTPGVTPVGAADNSWGMR